MYKIIEKTTGYIVDIAKINVEIRKELEQAGFICEKVGE